MAKISPVSIKYTVYASFVAEGRLEKPDVIGAIFGQTEGLLGSELEMRELQKEGKIGRIDVELKYEDSKTMGKIIIPSALDKAETTIIGAAIETIERIGPSDSKIQIEKIEDVRGGKREYILERAKKLLEQFQGSVPESRDMSDSIKESVKIAKLQEYGDEKLPAGDLSGNELIVVEGRADVIALLKNNVTNVIGMNGTKLPEGVKQLSREKEVTLFVDGDRGGQLIIKNVVDNANVKYIAVAPDGKEVEELTGKEILYALRKKISVDEYISSMNRRPSRTSRERFSRERTENFGSEDASKERARRAEKRTESRELTPSDMKKIESLAKEIEGERSAYFLNEKLEVIGKAPSLGISGKLIRTREQVYAIIIDGSVNPGIIYSAERAGVSHIIAKNFAPVDTSINLV